MKNSNIINITMNLTGWPAAITCGAGILVIGGVTAFLGSKMIDNNYQLTNPKCVSLASCRREPSADAEVPCDNTPQPIAA